MPNPLHPPLSTFNAILLLRYYTTCEFFRWRDDWHFTFKVQIIDIFYYIYLYPLKTKSRFKYVIGASEKDVHISRGGDGVWEMRTLPLRFMGTLESWGLELGNICRRSLCFYEYVYQCLWIALNEYCLFHACNMVPVFELGVISFETGSVKKVQNEPKFWSRLQFLRYQIWWPKSKICENLP